MKKFLFSLSIICILIYYLLFPQITVNASKRGLLLWGYQILPVLFPCTLLTSIIVSSKLIDNNNPFLAYSILLLGSVLGFPLGAKFTTDFYKVKAIDKRTAQTLINYSNNFSPIFIMGYANNCINQNNHPIYIVLGLIFLPTFFSALALRFCTGQKFFRINKKSASRFQLNMQIFDAGIISSFEILIKLCGYIVVFSILTTILKNIMLPNSVVLKIILSFCEITNGLNILKSLTLSPDFIFVFGLGLLSFGGLSCIAQTGSIINGTDLSLKHYFIAKLINCLITVVLAIFYLFFSRYYNA